jgi:hypothetical protein
MVTDVVTDVVTDIVTDIVYNYRSGLSSCFISTILINR